VKKVLVIVGPTAAGKSDFALTCAHRFGGEIISGDSIQVYRGFDIGAGKETAAQQAEVPHHLIDICDPKQPYSTCDFQRDARFWIEKCQGLPILAGGTGLYLKACLYDYDFAPEEASGPADPTLETLSSEALYQKLQETDPAQAAKIHPHNRRRLLRALTIQERTGQTKSQREQQQTHRMVYDAWLAGCTMARRQLYQRIDARVERMFEEGLPQEVEGLLARGVTFDDPPMHGIGYQEFRAFYEEGASLAEVKAAIQLHSRHYAKKQYTWLRHQMPVHWFDITDAGETAEMLEKIEAWRRQDAYN
jgi:tRNA dimethylallyltransferase